MRGPFHKLISMALMGLLLTIQLPEPAEARATVEDRELVSSRRVGRTEFLYSYTLSINNQGPALDDVTVYVSCEANGTTLVDDIVEFGDIPEDAVTTSTDTFSIRQNRRIPFDPDCLVYEIGFDTPLIISGLATDEPLANALITAIVVRPASGRPIIDSGRPIIDSYSTFADDQGNYTLEVEAITQEDFITLEADGVGEQDEALLTSTVGSVGALHDVGTSGSIIVGSSDFGALTITHITTAQDELVRRLNGGELPTTDGELAALRSQVNGAELLTLASVIKTIIDNPNIVLPPGINNTLELIQNPGVFAEVLEDLETNFPDELAEATQQTAADLNIGFSGDSLPETLYAVVSSKNPFVLTGNVFGFDPNGSGSVVLGDGDSSTTWTINTDGEIVVALLDPPVTESFRFDSSAPSGQVRTLIFVDQIRLIKLTDGPSVDQILLLPRTVTRFPDNPGMDDEVTETPASPAQVHIAFGPLPLVALAADDVAGGERAAYYFHDGNNSVGLGFNGEILGADRLVFDSDGVSGTTVKRQFAFTWSIVDGALDIDFSNGDRTRYVAYSVDELSEQVLAIGTLASTGESYVLSSRFIEKDGAFEFTEPNLVNRLYRSAIGALSGDESFLLDYAFLPGGEGCRITTIDGETGPPQRTEWQSTANNKMDLFRFVDGVTDPRVRRSWEALRTVPGAEGDRVWVIENADFSGLSGATEFTDPDTTPGRITAYEFVEDLSQVSDPCGFAPAPMLRLTVNGTITSRNDIAGLPSPVDGPVGTAFSVSWDLDSGIDPFELPDQYVFWQDVITRLAFATPSSSGAFPDNLGSQNNVFIETRADRSYYNIEIGVDVPQAPYRYFASMLLNGPASLDLDDIGQLDPRPLSQWDPPAPFANFLNFATCPVAGGGCTSIGGAVDSITFGPATTTTVITVLSNNAFLILPDGSSTALDQGGTVEFEVDAGGGNVQLYSCGWPDPPFPGGCRFIDYLVFQGESWEVVDTNPFPRIIMQRAID